MIVLIYASALFCDAQMCIQESSAKVDLWQPDLGQSEQGRGSLPPASDFVVVVVMSSAAAAAVFHALGGSEGHEQVLKEPKVQQIGKEHVPKLLHN